MVDMFADIQYTRSQKSLLFRKKMICNLTQYRILRNCSIKRSMHEWNRWRDKYPKKEIMLQGADLSGFWLQGANLSEAKLELANLEKADLSNSDCREASFREANCQDALIISANCQKTNFRGAKCLNTYFTKTDCRGASFFMAKCQDAKFRHTILVNADCKGANFQRTDFTGAFLQSALFSRAKMDNGTVLMPEEIDDCTNFSHCGLGSVIIKSGVKAKLEQNIRRMNWQGWSKQVLQQTINYDFQFLRFTFTFLYTSIVKFFWHISDYGYSTKRVFLWFFYFVLIFVTLYTVWPTMLSLNGVQMTQGHPAQMLAFAMSTMITLGFSNINVAIVNGEPHIGGMVAVSANLMVGYFMLAVIVTRLAVLFQTLGPGYVLAQKLSKTKGNQLNKKC